MNDINNENSRLETKILIESNNYHHTLELIKNNKKNFKEIYHPRFINNIYFDTYDFKSFHQNLNGDFKKRKVRIRWYGKLEGQIQAVLEYKIKKKFNCLKKKYKLKSFQFDQKINKRKIHYSVNNSEIPQIIKLDLKSLCPQFINRYNRQYFLSEDGSIRLTVDRFLKYYKFINLKFPVNVSYIVIELKYNSSYAPEINNVVSELGSRWSTFSKFFLGTNIIYS